MILLDTDICIEILCGNQHVLNKRLEIVDRVAISFMTVGELYYGAEKSKSRIKNRHIIDEFILAIDVINSDIDILRKFGEIKRTCELNGFPLADADILIAATCLLQSKKLITGKIKHYERIDNLIIENWIR